MKALLTTMSVLTGLSLAVPATAQQQKGDKQQKDQAAQQQRGQQTPYDFDWLYVHDPAGPDVLVSDEALWRMHQQVKNVSVSGTVINTRDLNLDGETHRLVRLRTDRGNTMTIDLGDKNLRQEIKHGERFSATGDIGRISNVPVLMASKAEFGGSTINIGHQAHFDSTQQQVWQQGREQQQGQQQARQDQQQQQARDQQGLQQLQGQRVSLRGEVLSHRTTSIQGQQYTIAKVRTTRGNTLNVNLGTGDLGFDLEKGTTILAAGRLGRLNNEPTVFAHFAQANDETFVLEQPLMRQGRQQADEPRYMGQRPGDAEEKRGQAEERKEAAKKKAEGKRKDAEKRKDKDKKDKKSKADIKQGQELSVTGSLTDARLVSIDDEADRHVLVKIDTEDKGTIIANLGSRQEVSNQLRENQLRLRKGQELTLEGVAGRINDRPVLMVQRMSTEDTEIDLPQKQTGKQQDQSHMQRGQ